jgi:death-on-curing family protein
MRPKPITIAEVEYTAFSLAKERMTWDEPIPDFGSRYPNALESCLGQPFARFGGKDLYRGLAGKGTTLFYLLIKNHPFKNGNKRIAVMSLLYFLYKNGKWLDVDKEGLYRFAKGVARTKPAQRSIALENIHAFLLTHTVDF